MLDDVIGEFRANPLDLITWVWQRDIAHRLIEAGMDHRKAFLLAIYLQRAPRHPLTACWDWTGDMDWPVTVLVAHYLKEPLSDGMKIHSVCGFGRCCNPDHLVISEGAISSLDTKMTMNRDHA